MTVHFDAFRHIIDDLYCDGLVLADEVRSMFDLSYRDNLVPADSNEQDLVRSAISCEALRTTTRMMHAIAWILEQKTHIEQGTSKARILNYLQLPSAYKVSSPNRSGEIPEAVMELIARTEEFYDRLVRLDRENRRQNHGLAAGIGMLEEKLGVKVAA